MIQQLEKMVAVLQTHSKMCFVSSYFADEPELIKAYLYVAKTVCQVTCVRIFIAFHMLSAARYAVEYIVYYVKISFPVGMA